MSISRFVSSCAVLLLLNSSLAFSQKKPNVPADEKPRRVRREPSDVFKNWPKSDVAPIITEEERKAYEKLATDEEREQFIETFWRMRDPDPDTQENEYKDQYYERIAYANEHFTSGKAGWLTDRGQIYIKFGKPDEIESHPSGGPYQQASYEGDGSITTYPFERWFYRYIPGIGSGIEIEFVDPTGSGEYRLARSPREKNVMAHATPDEPNDRFRRAQDSPFAIIELHSKLFAAPEFKGNPLEGALTGSPKIDDNPLDFQVSPSFFRQSDNRVITAFTIQTENRELSFPEIGGLPTARMNIFGHITAVNGRPMGSFEDAVSTVATPSELIEARERKSAYAKAVVLPPGRYRIAVRVRDIESGAEGLKLVGFQVPSFMENKLAVSSLVLTARLDSMKGQAAVGPFIIGQHKVIPNLTHVYKQGQPVGLYLQIYNSGIDQTTLRPSVDVEYVLMRDGKQVNKQVEDWNGSNETGERLTLARLLDSAHLTPGDYRLEVRIKDQVSGQTLAPSATFTVVK